MITTGIDKRVKIQQIIENQIPEFFLSESPKAVDFLKQYYISQEHQGGVIDLTDNLDQYLKIIPCGLDNKKVTSLKDLGIYKINNVNNNLESCWVIVLAPPLVPR